jgi:hypothetical protein
VNQGSKFVIKLFSIVGFIPTADRLRLRAHGGFVALLSIRFGVCVVV